MARKPRPTRYTRRGRPEWAPNKVQIREAGLAAGNGATLEQIARAILRCSPATLYRYLARYPEGELLEALKNGKAETVMLMAGKLVDMAEKGNIAALIFYLKAQAGWRDRAEITGPGGGPLEISAVKRRPSGMNAEKQALTLELLDKVRGKSSRS